ncbi:hypothetical protein ABE65_020050 [Fictibacillus phosphorivorans]|uniref:DUF3889 domain-containing protein n=1 Tax=Fictibacillus phosphorivorans TaxID=1221500 RepID=A0A160IR32_9BACL|nr:DUF3889 domain-containing protein [Fictibacillus phosphorivorans]ANC78968.1 hypothetical protein ABE65_020050 [Fictibacillus phosphorivorans]
MKQKIIIFFALTGILVAGGCMNNDKKPTEESTDMRNNVENERTKPLNVQYNDQTPSEDLNSSVTQKDYAKWGKMALAETKKKYPNSDVSDYQYDTRRVSPDGTISDFFDFTVYENGKKRVVKVGVMHTDEKLVDMKVEELN